MVKIRRAARGEQHTRKAHLFLGPRVTLVYVPRGLRGFNRRYRPALHGASRASRAWRGRILVREGVKGPLAGAAGARRVARQEGPQTGSRPRSAPPRPFRLGSSRRRRRRRRPIAGPLRCRRPAHLGELVVALPAAAEREAAHRQCTIRTGKPAKARRRPGEGGQGLISDKGALPLHCRAGFEDGVGVGGVRSAPHLDG